MKLPCKPNTPKKYLATMVLLSLIIMAYFITRNSGEWHSAIYTRQSWIKDSHTKNISVKLSADIQSKIEMLVLFIGYPRSGHTLIGSLLDAHPHVVIANELDIFQRWTEWTNEEKTRENLINKMYDNSYKQAVLDEGFRSTTKIGRSYAVPNQWQGKYKDYIKVIGDKKGGKSTRFFIHQWNVTTEVLDEINLPLRFVHMVRNPYDNVATMVLRYLKIRTSDALTSKNKINNTDALKANVRLHTSALKSNYKLMKRFGRSVITLHSEDVIAKPRKSLKKLCAFLAVSCSEEYLNDCASILYTSSSKTRETLVWPFSQKKIIEKAINIFPFLNRYNFES